MTYVFDTGALSLFYAEDERLRHLVERIDREKVRGLISSVTLSEFYYKTCQTLGREVATLWCRQVSERMQVVPADPDLARSAGLEKCRNGRLSLADAHALALALKVKGTLLTTDSELAKCKSVEARYFEV